VKDSIIDYEVTALIAPINATRWTPATCWEKLFKPYTVNKKSERGMKRHHWVGIVVAVVLGISTLIPAPAGKPSLLGYYAHCSFTPISTVICWAIAGVIYWLGRKKK